MEANGKLEGVAGALSKNLVLISVGIGIFFPVVSIWVDLVSQHLPWSIVNIQEVFGSSLLHSLIMGMSVFTALLFFVGTRIILVNRASLLLKEAKREEQWSILQELISDLDSKESVAVVRNDFENKTILAQLNQYKDKLIVEKQQEEIRLWKSQGMTLFNDILRSTHDVSKLSDEVLKFVVNYTRSNQGSLYLLTTQAGHEVLELKAIYAYSRKKYVTGSVQPGEGLVGQCYLEKETVRLLQVPADYIKITSGLGEATPRSVVLVPLKWDDTVCGVLELASFVEHTKSTIEFLETLAAALASTVQTVNTNTHVRNLLEQSQQQTEELRAQEEEMRQNMEELQAIQEQLSRQLAENNKVQNQLEARENVLGLTTILSESDLFGTITFVNSKFCEVSQYSREELIGKPHNVLRHTDMPAEIFRLMWATIKQGKVFQGIVKNRKKNGEHYWVDATIVPIFENGKIVKYIGARYHIQDDLVAERMFQEQLEQLGLAEPMEITEVDLEVMLR